MAGCMKHIHASIILSALLAVLTFGSSAQSASNNQSIVVELFTSEGCSSCPPADDLLGELAQQDDVIALGFHVDYWDYIGWPDPFADALYTKRQRTYAKLFGSRTVYTPQMVFQGTYEAAGSRPGKVAQAIERARALPQLTVALSQPVNGKISIEIGSGNPRDADIVLVTYIRHQQTSVTRGENAGRTLSHSNVVRSVELIGRWNGAAMTLKTATEPVLSGDVGCAVLVQSRSDGRILGAAAVNFGS